MSDYPKKHEVPHIPPSPMKDSEARIPAEASKTHSDTASDTAAADKSKRESGKDKEHRKR